MFFFTDFWSIKRSWNIFWEKQGHQKTVRKSWQKSILSSLCMTNDMQTTHLRMALVRSDVCGCLGAWKCSANPLVGLLGRIKLWSRWLVSMVVFFYLLWGRMIQSLLCNKNVRWKPPRCEPLHLPLFLCSSIREEHFCRTSALCHRCAALLLWQWPHLQLVTWMIQRILGALISATYAVGYLGFLSVLINLATRLTIRISGGAGFLYIINCKYQLYLSVGTWFHFWFVIGDASLKRNDGPDD